MVLNYTMDSIVRLSYRLDRNYTVNTVFSVFYKLNIIFGLRCKFSGSKY